jgi:hypothetical protein
MADADREVSIEQVVMKQKAQQPAIPSTPRQSKPATRYDDYDDKSYAGR